ARARVHQPAPGRRDQPGHTQDPERAARGDAGGAGHRRGRAVPARGSVPGHRHPKPDRARGDLSAARGPARTLPDAPARGLPGPRRRDRDPGPPAPAPGGRRSHRSGDLARGAGRHASVPRGRARGRGHRALHRGSRAGDPVGSAGRARRLAPRHPRAAQAGPRRRRARPARLRAARRREGDGGARPRAPPDPQARAVGGPHLAHPGGGEPPRAGPRAGPRRSPRLRMTARVTLLALSLLAVAGWAVSLAVLLARPELLLVALPGVLALATLGRRGAVPRYTIAHRLSADRLFEGETLTVTVTVEAVSPIALLELRGPLPAGAVLRAGRPRARMVLRAGESAEWSYDVRFPRRGVHDRGAVAVRIRDRLG